MEQTPAQLSPPTLEYHRPEPGATAGRWYNDLRITRFVLGCLAGSVLLMVPAVFGGVHPDPALLIVAPIFFLLTGGVALLVIPVIFFIRREALGEPREARMQAFGPLFAVLYYPAFHAACCKLAALREGEKYVLWASPFQFLLPWLIFGTALTFAAWRATPFGRRALDWFIAGFVVPVSFFATVTGFLYLYYSARRHRDPADMVTLLAGVIALFLAPLLIGCTFNTQRIDRPK